MDEIGEKIKERYGDAIGKFVFIRYKSVMKNNPTIKQIILRWGILEKIFDDGILRIRHKNKSEVFWDIKGDQIIEFSAEEVKKKEGEQR